MLVLVLLGSGATPAQDLGDDVTLLERLVISASGSGTDIRTAPASVSVVSSEDLENADGKTLEQVLSTIPGVAVSKSGNLQFVQIRGLPSKYSLFLIDGKRVNSDPNLFRGNDFDAGWLPLSAIDRIEVVRGSMSSLYGSDAIGGVVNIITKKSADTFSGSITQEVTLQENRTSGDYFRTSGYLSGPIVADVLSFNIGGSWDHRNADADDVNAPYVDWSGDYLAGFLESENRQLNASLHWTPDEWNTLDLDFSHAYREHDTIPIDRNAISLTHKGSYDFFDTELRIVGDRVHNFQGTKNAVEYAAEPNTAYNVNVDGRVIIPWDTVVPQTVTIGGALQYQQLDDNYILSGDGTSSVYQRAAYIEDIIELTDRLTLTLGGRADYHERYGFHGTPRAFAVYELTDTLTLKTGVSTSFKAPTLLQASSNWLNLSCGGSCYVAGSPDMEPETGVSGEFGINYEDDSWSWGVTYFRNELSDVIVSSPDRTSNIALGSTYDNYVGLNSDGLPIYRYYNSDSLSSHGIEANVAVNLVPDWTIKAGYTYVRSITTNADVESTTLYQPSHIANLGVTWQANEQLQLAADLSVYSEQVTSVVSSTGEALTKVPGYAELDLAAKYEFNDNFSVRAAVLNVFDKQILREDTNGFNVDGRRYTLSATAKF